MSSIPDSMINLMIEDLATQWSRGSKKFTQALLSALTGFLLAFLLLFGKSDNSVKIPFLDISVPIGLAVYIFLLASMFFGFTAAYHNWRSIKIRNGLANFYPHLTSDQKAHLSVKYLEIYIKASPLNRSIIVLVLATLAVYILHVATHWSMFTINSSLFASCVSNWLCSRIGVLGFASLFGIFGTGQPFGWIWAIEIPFRIYFSVARQEYLPAD